MSLVIFVYTPLLFYISWYILISLEKFWSLIMVIYIPLPFDIILIYFATFFCFIILYIFRYFWNVANICVYSNIFHWFYSCIYSATFWDYSNIFCMFLHFVCLANTELEQQGILIKIDGWNNNHKYKYTQMQIQI